MSKIMLVQGMGTAVYIIELAVLLWVSQSKYKKQYYVQSKMLCSVTFVVLAVIFALVSHHLEYFFGLFPALCFCMLGDLFMGLYQIERRRRNLILGILTFMLGHLFLLILLFYRSREISWWNVFVPVVAVILLFVMRKMAGMRYGKVWPLAICYCIFLALMLSKSTEIMICSPSIATVWIGLGGILFFVSDFTINFIYFYKIKNPIASRWVHAINLATYFLAILAFDLSILYDAM